jgi:hypothetical protein
MLSMKAWWQLMLAAFALLVSLQVAGSPLDGLRDLERQLRLKPEQKLQFDAASAATQRALVGSALAAAEFKDRFTREMLRPRPDFAELFAAQDAMVEMNRPLLRAARDEWVRLYAMLDDEQARIAKGYVDRTLMGAEALAEVFRRALGQLR